MKKLNLIALLTLITGQAFATANFQQYLNDDSFYDKYSGVVSRASLESAIDEASIVDDSQLTAQQAKIMTKTDKGILIPLPWTDEQVHTGLRAMGVVGVLLMFDQPVLDFVQDTSGGEAFDTLADIGYEFGGKNMLPIMGGALAVSLVFKNQKLKSTTLKTVGAAALSGLITETLKSLTHRSRPNKEMGPYDFNGADWVSHNTSFPSGHSTAAWAIATVVAHEFKDKPLVPEAMYALAAITSWSRVRDNKHWGSDVFLGGVIGYLTAKAIVGNDQDKKSRYNLNIQVIPYEDRKGEKDGAGIMVSLTKRAPKKVNKIDRTYCLEESMFPETCLDHVKREAYLLNKR